MKRGAEDNKKKELNTDNCMQTHASAFSLRDQKVDTALISVQYEARDFKLSIKTYNKGKQLVWLCPEVN